MNCYAIAYFHVLTVENKNNIEDKNTSGLS